MTTLQLPLALHEGAIRKLKIRDADGKIVFDGELEAVEAAMASARADADRVAALHEAASLDRTMTPQAAALKVREVALRSGERASEKLDTARARVSREIEQLRRTTASPPAPKATAALQSEIRARLAQMPKPDRDKLLNEALKAADDTILSAVLAAPPMLSGMAVTEHNMRVEQFRRSRFPKEANRLDRLQRAVEAIDRGGTSLVAFIEAAASSPAAQAAEAATAKVREAVAAAAE